MTSPLSKVLAIKLVLSPLLERDSRGEIISRVEKLRASVGKKSMAVRGMDGYNRFVDAATNAFFAVGGGGRGSAVFKSRAIDAYAKLKRDFEAQIIAACDNYLSGRLTKKELKTAWNANRRTAFSSAIRLGAASVGNPWYDKRGITDEDKDFVSKAAAYEREFSNDLIDVIDEIANPDTKGNKMSLEQRLEMHINSLDAIFNNGVVLGMPADTQWLWTLHPAEHCFVGSTSWYPVLTSSGWKTMDRISVGDRVLSHKGKWCKVTKVIDRPCYDKHIYKVTLFNGKHYYTTGEHKLMVGGEWIRVDRMGRTTRVDCLGHACAYCGEPVKYANSNKLNSEVCSPRCGNLLWRSRNPDLSAKRDKNFQKKRFKDGETYDEKFGEEKANEIRKKASARGKELTSRGENPFQKMFARMSTEERSAHGRRANSFVPLESKREGIRKAYLAIPVNDTVPELIFASILDTLGVEHKKQVEIGPYRADFFLPGVDTYVEINGDYWHANPKLYNAALLSESQDRTIKRDRMKDEYYKEKGLHVIRFWEHDLRNDPKRVVATIQRLFDNHNENYLRYDIGVKSVEKIERPIGRSTFGRWSRMHCLVVDGDHSFIVRGGLISHNCGDCIALAAGSPYTRNTLVTVPRAGDTACLSNCQCTLDVVGAKPDPAVVDEEGNEPPSAVSSIADRMNYARQMAAIAETKQEKMRWWVLRKELNKQLSQEGDFVPVVSVNRLVETVRSVSTMKGAVLVEEPLSVKGGERVTAVLGVKIVSGQVVDVSPSSITINSISSVVEVPVENAIVFSHV